MWPLPPIALQILHYLDDADDAFAFLQAAPNDSLDDALDALRTLLAMDPELPLWPTADIASLEAAYNVSPSVVMMALPLFKKITFGFCDKPSIIGHNTVLAPTTAVSANVLLDDFVKIRGALGNWLPNLAHLRVHTRHTYGLVPTTKDDLATCRGLRSLAIQHSGRLDQDEFDAALMAVVAASAQIGSVCVSATQLSYISDCTPLVAWLALPMARHLELNCTDFHGDLGAELATTMLTSSTLEKIHLFGAPSLTRAILSPSSPPLPPQLRHLAIIVNTTEYDSDSSDDDIDPPPAFDEADATALAAKIATSRLHTLEFTSRAFCDVTSVVTVLPQVPTLTKLALQGAHLTAFPPLRHLWHLDLCWTTFSDEAVASLAALLCSLPKLVLLDLGWDPLPNSQAQTILRALPQWLSRRGTACNVRLALASDANASVLATALAQTRNSHKVKITIHDWELSLAAKKQLLAALRATSRMAMVFLDIRHAEKAALEAFGRQQHLTTAYRKEGPKETKECWFFSPRSTTN